MSALPNRFEAPGRVLVGELTVAYDDRLPAERRQMGGRRGPGTTGSGGRGRVPSFETPGALALVGVWGEFVEDDEIDAMLGEIYAARERDTGRPVDLEV